MQQTSLKEMSRVAALGRDCCSCLEHVKTSESMSARYTCLDLTIPHPFSTAAARAVNLRIMPAAFNS